MKQIFVITIMAVFYSCNGNKLEDLGQFMVDISEFNIDNSILKDGDYVEILGSSDKLTRDHKINFYNLVVVRSKETGDTINVLVTNYFVASSNNPETRFISNLSDIGKLVDQQDNLIDLKEGENIKNLKSKSFKKVFYDTDWISVDVREYPSITGNLGDYIIESGKLNE